MFFYGIVSDTEGAGEDQELSEIEENKQWYVLCDYQFELLSSERWRSTR